MWLELRHGIAKLITKAGMDGCDEAVGMWLVAMGRNVRMRHGQWCWGYGRVIEMGHLGIRVYVTLECCIGYV
jgi:hypothetical protein